MSSLLLVLALEPRDLLGVEQQSCQSSLVHPFRQPVAAIPAIISSSI